MSLIASTHMSTSDEKWGTADSPFKNPYENLPPGQDGTLTLFIPLADKYLLRSIRPAPKTELIAMGILHKKLMDLVKSKGLETDPERANKLEKLVVGLELVEKV